MLKTQVTGEWSSEQKTDLSCTKSVSSFADPTGERYESSVQALVSCQGSPGQAALLAAAPGTRGGTATGNAAPCRSRRATRTTAGRAPAPDTLRERSPR